jgi:hypothetical protein
LKQRRCRRRINRKTEQVVTVLDVLVQRKL